MRPRIRLYTLLALSLLLGYAEAAHADINIETSLYPNRAVVGQRIQLTITITGAGSGLRTPQFPPLANFDAFSEAHSEELSFVNGETTSRSTFSFALIPKLSGKHVIDNLEVPIKGVNYKIPPVEVEVLDGPNNQAAPQRSIPGIPQAQTVPAASSTLPEEMLTQNEIFVKPWVDKVEVFVNEPITLTYTLYTRASATFKGFEEEPVVTGFWVEDFPPPGMSSREEKYIGGYKYLIADVRSMALFPTEAGQYEIEPGRLKVDIELRQNNPWSVFSSRSIFGRSRVMNTGRTTTRIEPRVLETETIHINARPLPTFGRPKSFVGAVGRYNIQATLDAKEVAVGEAVTFRLRIQGEGNMTTLEVPPLPVIDHFKYYDSSTTMNLQKDRYRVEGEKIVETVIVPRQAGDYKIPPIEFSYFDPQKEEYVVLRTESLRLKVTGDAVDDIYEPDTYTEPLLPKEDKTVQSKDAAKPAGVIQGLKSSIGRIEAVDSMPYAAKDFWLWRLAALAGLFALHIMAAIFAKFGGKNKGLSDIKKSHAVARRKLRAAKQHLKTGHETKFLEALSKSVNAYFAARLGLSVGMMNIKDLEDRLRGQAHEDEIKRVTDLLTRIDFERFSSSAPEVSKMKELYQEADEVISFFERKKLKR